MPSDRITPWLFLAISVLVIIAPFDEGPGRDLTPFTLFAVTTVLLAAGWLSLRHAATWPRLNTPAALPLLLFIALAGASVFWSIDPFVSLLGMVRLAACATVFLVIVTELSSAQNARSLCALLVGFTVMLAALGVWQGVTERGLFVSQHGVRAHSVFVTPNTFGAFLIAVLPMALLGVFAGRRAATRVAAALATLLIAVALVLSQSRGAWAAGGFGLFVFGWHLAKVRGISRRRRWGMASAVGLAAVLLALLTATARPDLRRRVVSLLRPDAAASFTERLRYWGSSLKMAQAAWPLGTGLDTFHLAYPAHRHASLAGTEQWYAHNDYLQTAVELGIPGLLLLLWFLGRMARTADRALRTHAGDERGPVLAAYLAGAAGVLLHCLVDYNLYVPATAVVLFICLGIIAAADRQPSERTEAAERGPARRWASYAIIALGVVAVPVVLSPLAGQMLATRASRDRMAAALSPPGSDTQRKLLAQARHNARLATRVCPLSAAFLAQRASMQADTEEAIRLMRRAVRLSPANANLHLRLGELLLHAAEHRPSKDREEDGLAHIRRAVRLDPYAALIRFRAARALAHSGRRDEAKRHYRFCLARCRPTDALRTHCEAALNEISDTAPQQ